jgi:lysylphosphatidylglycerol synthetase-like protein (DUF2156 family)
MTHRHYLYAEDKEGNICALAILAQLASRYGVQVKWALDFPNAPNGGIEYVTQVAMDAAKADGNERVTFGGGATAKLTAGHNIGGTKITALDKSYQAIAAKLKLNPKTDFRAKFHTFDDPIYICYPPHGGLGVGGIQAILEFFRDER